MPFQIQEKTIPARIKAGMLLKLFIVLFAWAARLLQVSGHDLN